MIVDKGKVVLAVRDVCKTFHIGRTSSAISPVVKALDHVSFEVRRGETLALVGESGSGKTTMGRIIAGLEKQDSGIIDFSSREKSSRKERKGMVQLVFQDPFASLDPRFSVRKSIEEPLIVQGGLSKNERSRRVDEIADAVGLSGSMIDKLPHMLSGGQRQRANIARALVSNPELVVLDEPVSALDVSVQAQVLNLLKDLQERYGTTYLFISHDMSVVRFMADWVAVMRKGVIVEEASAGELFDCPRREYTQQLLAAVPRRVTL